jgi:Arc/MetJ family transcription regulator
MRETHGSYTKIAPNGVCLRMARTNIDIDDELIEKAMRLTDARTKREAVQIALERLVEKETLYRALRKMKGRHQWGGDVGAWRRSR